MKGHLERKQAATPFRAKEPLMEISLKILRGVVAIILASTAFAAQATPSTGYFIYDESGHLIGEYDQNGNMVQEHIYLNDRPVAVATTSGMNYVTTDQLGTPRAITDSSQNLEWSWTSDPFGNGQPTGSLTYNLRLPGQYYDAENGLIYNGENYYKPDTGRWLDADGMNLAEHVEHWRARALLLSQPPLEDNPYVRAVNNPLHWVDVDGFEAGAASIPATPAAPAARPFPIEFPWFALPSATAAAVLAGILAAVYSPALCENENAERCKIVREQCIRGCSDFVLQKPRNKRGDLGGMDFHKCVRLCLDRNGC